MRARTTRKFSHNKIVYDIIDIDNISSGILLYAPAQRETSRSVVCRSNGGDGRVCALQIVCYAAINAVSEIMMKLLACIAGAHSYALIRYGKTERLRALYLRHKIIATERCRRYRNMAFRRRCTLFGRIISNCLQEIPNIPPASVAAPSRAPRIGSIFLTNCIIYLLHRSNV